jgi:branched chain amino acid efflux pump
MQHIEEYGRIDVIILLFIVAAMTYLTRAGGYLVLSRFSRISPRAEAALEAVPAAVITAIVIPPAASGGPAEILTILVAGAAALRFSALSVLLAGLGTLVAARSIGL